MKRKFMCAVMAALLFASTLPAFAERNEDETIQLEGDTYSYTYEDSLTEQFEEYNVAYESANDNILNDYALSIDFDSGEEYAMVTPSISYQAHIADIGWQPSVTSTSSSVKTAGTTGQAKQMEALKITLNNESGQSMIKYQAHVSNIGWQGWKNSGEIAGTTGRSLAIEAFQIKLNSPYSNSYDVLYRVHTANKGWLEWAKNGETAGSTGMALRIEAIEIKIVDKNSVHTSSEKASLIKPSLSYRTHVSNKGWLASVKEGETSGTTGEALQMEALQINLNDFDNKAAISYRAHVSNIGWQAWKNSGETAGTTGQSLAIEAVEIKLSDSLTPFFDVYYRLHCKDYGWLGWAKNGETAGTTGGALRAEAIEIQLVVKNAAFTKGGAAYVDASKKTIAPSSNVLTGLNNSTMTSIANKIGTQSQKKYLKSAVMCTAFSMAYCRAYIFNDYSEPIDYWGTGGAQWYKGGGKKTNYPTNAEVLSAIKSQIDSGKPCIVRVNSSNGGHCVVAFKYSGNGTSTSDFTIIDPWSAKIKTLNNYTIHSSDKYIVTF